MAIKIQVLGTGCAKCADLAKNAEAAAKAAGVAYELEKVSDVQKIMQFGVMMTPGLVVDGKVVSSGKVLSPEEITVFLKPAAGTADAAPSCCAPGCACGTESTAPQAGGSKKSTFRLWGFLLLALAVAGVLWLKNNNSTQRNNQCRSDLKCMPGGGTQPAATAVTPATNTPNATPAAEKPTALPKLVDLGAIGCKPCKIMDGVLEELRKGYPGKLDVEFINVRTDEEKAEAYQINLIPTQIWLDAAGKELFRHEGVMSAADIAAKFKELGIDLGTPVAGSATPAPAAEATPAAGDKDACCPQ